VIVADKRGPFASLVAAYVHRKVRRSFRGVWVHGTLPPPASSLVVYANHTNFWDGFIAAELCWAGGWDGYCMMEERQLARYRFLARLGAFSIRRGDAQSALETLRYARGLLARPSTAVVVFPEGVLRPSGSGPHPLERGVEVLSRQAGVRCLPVGIRYRFFEHELPDVVIGVGEPHGAASLDVFTERLAAAVADVDERRPLDDFRPLLRGRRSVMERWDAVRAAGRVG
jgi:1-acyl-sn-glycerol-3-phosphate acyltransferase